MLIRKFIYFTLTEFTSNCTHHSNSLKIRAKHFYAKKNMESSTLGQRKMLSHKSNFFLFTADNPQDDSIIPETLQSCHYVIFFQPTGIFLKFKRVGEENGQRFLFVYPLEGHPILRIDISDRGVQNCLATGDFRKKCRL